MAAALVGALFIWLFFYTAPANDFTIQRVQLGDTDIHVILPAGKSDKRLIPLVYSHGYTECGNRFLMRALIQNGYAVFAPLHKDSLCRRIYKKKIGHTDVPFETPQKWSHQTNSWRRDDIIKVLDTVSNMPEYRSFAWDKLGFIGYSFGGYVGLGMAGGWQQWNDERIRSLVLLSPYAYPFMVQRAIKNVTIPVMYQSGTKDFLVKEMYGKLSAYEQSNAPKCYIEFAGANHTAWGFLKHPNQYTKSIAEYTVAFFDHTLKGKPFPPRLMEKSPIISALRFDLEPQAK